LSYLVPVNLLPRDVEAGCRNLKHRVKLERVEQKVRVEEGLVDRDCDDRADICRLQLDN
jgi:hypothetical protein